MDTHIHVHVYVREDPSTGAALARIEAALATQRQDEIIMTKVTDAILLDIEQTVAGVTSSVDAAVKAFAEAQVKANEQLAAELAAEGADVTKLTAFNTALKANVDRLVSITLSGTPADTGAAVPDAVATR